MTKPIQVYRFDEAPKELLDLVDNHDDADWLVFVPKEYENEYIAWLDHIGCCDVTTYAHPSGDKIYVGYHS